MLTIEKNDATITNVNFRKQNHGAEKVAAVDITLTLKASNRLLDSIDQRLRPAFFVAPGKGDQQALPMEDDPLTALAMPFLGEQKLAHEYEDYEVTLASLLEHIEPVFFVGAKVKKLAFTPIEGGSIALAVTAAVLIDEDDDAPLLAAWRRGEVKLSLMPPAARDEDEDEPNQSLPLEPAPAAEAHTSH